jgi:uncharacterized membrane protein YbaN (DUF454 family)
LSGKPLEKFKLSGILFCVKHELQDLDVVDRDGERVIVDEGSFGAPAASAVDPRAATPRIMRGVFLALGIAFVALGFIGAFLPVLPTTPFLILAAACFARSSPRLENWLLEHPRFGPLLRGWRERGAIPVKAKMLALGGMAIGFAGFWFGSHPGPWLTAAVALLMLTGLTYVFTRPS